MNYLQVLAIVDASELFGDGPGNPDWQYCIAAAPFQHLEACEFIFPVSDEEEYQQAQVEELRSAGCTEAFVAEFTKAGAMGVRWLLFEG